MLLSFAVVPARGPSRPGLAEGALERMMTHVGYVDVRAEKMAVMLEWPSIEALTRYLMDVSPELAALLSDRWNFDDLKLPRDIARKLA